MTINERANWSNSRVYHNPSVIDTPYARRPNNVLGTILHFAKPAIVRKYVNPDGFIDGMAKRGDYESVELYCVIKPPTSGSRGSKAVLSERGEYSKGDWLLYYTPRHPKHEQPIHLQLADENSSNYSGFADVIEYQNDLWIVRELLKLDVDYVADDEYIGKALIKKWREPTHTKSHSNPNYQGHYQLK